VDVLSDGENQQRLEIGHDGIQIQRRGTERLLAPEREQLFDEGGGPAGSIDDLQDVASSGVVIGERTLQDLGEAENGSQLVVEVVRDTDMVLSVGGFYPLELSPSGRKTRRKPAKKSASKAAFFNSPTASTKVQRCGSALVRWPFAARRLSAKPEIDRSVRRRRVRLRAIRAS